MDAAKPEVNATPLIDVLLVLLVMMIITVPVATHQTTVNLPVAGNERLPMTEIRLEIDFDGSLYWNGTEVADDVELSRYLNFVGSTSNQPLLRVEPDRRVRYERVAQVLAAAQRSNVERLAVSGVSQ